MTHHDNPCLACGACCAFFRVSFYWTEADPSLGGTVLADLTDPMPPFRRAMKGTDQKEPRCIALHGKIGTEVCCSIYEHRPSVCCDFPISTPEEINTLCDKARAYYGLKPLVAPPPVTPPFSPNVPPRRAA